MTTRALPKRLASQLRILWLVAALLSLGCTTVRLVSEYDAAIDQGVTDVHTKVTAFVGKMKSLAGKPEGTYESNKQFYVDIQAQVATLHLRAKLQPKNDITSKLFDELSTQIEGIRKLHESGQGGGLAPALADPAMSSFDIVCTGILKFEIAKRRGEEN